MNNFERFLSFSNDKFINDDDNFVYNFTQEEYQAIDVDCELSIIISPEGTITLIYGDDDDIETEQTFSKEPTIKEIRKFIDDCMKTK